MRITISALTEVQVLKSLGAETIFSPLKPDLLSGYIAHAGKGFADPFIRKEIQDSKRSWGELIQSVFLTRDMMNALAACAEDLDTFYFSQTSSHQDIFSVNYDRMADILTETAIIFETIGVHGLFPRKVTILEGMWPTKSNIDWLRGRLRMYTY